MLLNKFLPKLFLFFLLTCCCFIVCAQTVNSSLLSKWQQARTAKTYISDTTNIRLLNQLSTQYLYNDADSSLYFAQEALKLAEYQKLNVGQAEALNSISKTYYVMGNYMLSLDAATRLMALSHKINYQPGIGWAYQVIGLIYLAQNKTDIAIANFNKAIAIFISIGDKSKTGKVYFDIALSYDETGHPQKAFLYLDKALQLAKQTNDNDLLSMALNRKGETYFHLKKYPEAISFYQQVLSSKLTDKWEQGFAYSGLAQTYQKLGQYKQAIINAGLSLALSKKVNSQSDVVRALAILAESHASLKDYKNAYHYQVRLKEASDSLFNNEKEKEINYLQLKDQQVDNIRLKKELKQREDSIAFSKRLLFFRNLIAGVVIIFVLVIIYNNRKKTILNRLLLKQNNDIAEQKEEILTQKETLGQLNHTKNQLFSVISHDLRSPFATIMQAIDGIKAGDISKEEQDILLDSFYQQVSLVNIMVNNLLIWASSQQAGIKTEMADIDAAALVAETISVCNYLAKNKNIILTHINTGAKIVHADADHVKIIVQNLIGNAIKFTPDGGEIKIFYTNDECWQVIHVKDNGTGIAPEKLDKLFKVTGREISGYGTNKEAGAGIGLALIKQFADANNGHLEVKSTPGQGSEFCVYLRKP
ncbi:tetratricopeptide repeat-containing sensor histidine kinase [Mucilaginibacter sp.]|uniref:tetratricopeptide repeat-containing sensor histidine kinase n=1 Tax=Mucilaginibacter sp. TaxID=1882438 RepID=UPI003D09FE31